MAVAGGSAACDLLPFLTCRSGEAWFAIPATTVEKVTEDAEELPVTSLPGTSMDPGNEGVAFLVTVSGGMRAGFSIDEVGVVRTFPATFFYALPDYMKGLCHKALWGVGFIEGRAYFLLNLSDIDPKANTKPPFKEESDV